MIIGALAIFIALGIPIFFKFGTAKRRAVTTLSQPAKRIYRHYKELPVESRPFPNILPILQGMDKAFDKKKVNGHFQHWNIDGAYFSWGCDCRRSGISKPCKYATYWDMSAEIGDLHKVIAEKNRVLTVQGVQGRLDEADMLLERLREESNIINQVTKELA